VADALSDWLRLREPADFAARSEALTRAVVETAPAGEPIRVLDLGTGTGSNVRYLCERLRRKQQWLAVDRSAALLAELPERLASWGVARGCETWIEPGRCVLLGPQLECDVETRQQDLGILDDHEMFSGRHLVTASALLDLVSESWLRALAAHCHAEGATALFAITYNGQFTCTPEEPLDNTVRDLMNRHQKTDKGLGGPAQGPEAAASAERCFVDLGYRVRRESSNWRLGPAEGDVMRLLIDGWAQAAAEMAPEQATAIARWRTRRLEHVAAGRSRVVVGHYDFAAWPPEQRRAV
jgi:SAM-dependent methyltransferase